MVTRPLAECISSSRNVTFRTFDQERTMSDDLPVSLDDLQPDEIQELLAEEGIEATEEQVRMITAFVASVGGLENAQGLFDELRQLRPAA